MKIGIPTFGSDSGKSGIGHYLVNLLRAMAQIRSSAELELITLPGERDIFLPAESNVPSRSIASWLKHPVLNIAWHQLGLSRWKRRRKCDVVFLPAANRRLTASRSLLTVGAVHDLSSFHVENKYDPVRMFYIKQVLPRLINRLSHVITMSESSKLDIVQYAQVPEDRITVIPLGVDHDHYYPETNTETIKQTPNKFRIQGPYILYVSRLEHPGKNHVRLIHAFEQLKLRHSIPHRLVLAGSDWNRSNEIHEAAAKSHVSDKILFTGYFPNEHLRSLYCGAEFLMFPSLYEGFGLPVLEAMACGTPVACSNLSSLPELAAGAAALFNPYSIDHMTSVMEKLVESPDLRELYRRRGLVRSQKYHWNITAKKTMDVLIQASKGAA